MAITASFYLPNSLFSHKPRKAISFSTPKFQTHEPFQTQVQTRTENHANYSTIHNPKAVAALFGAGLTLSLIGPASAAELPLLGFSLQLVEPANALSLPTWAIHVSSVVEWWAFSPIFCAISLLGFDNLLSVVLHFIPISLLLSINVVAANMMFYQVK